MFIEISKLTKKFQIDRNGKKSDEAVLTVLQDIDLEIRQGEFVSLLGVSGCGKTTLLRIVSGLLAADGGTVEVGGKRVTRPRPDLSMVFQNFGLLPWRSVLANVAFPLELDGQSKEARYAVTRPLLKLVGLDQFERHYPHELSGGMQQRVGIARALTRNPSVLLMDEPFAALDAQNRVILQAELVRIWEQTRKTVVYITHSIDEALLLGDRTVVMTAQPGRIKQVIDVPFPHPRDVLALSASAEFGRLKLEIWRVLEDEVNRARAEEER
jgi:NitT/TauT family transport system ATP-binding protein